MNAQNEPSIISEFINEYRKIDAKWLKMHFHTLIILCGLGFVFEVTAGIAYYAAGHVEMLWFQYVLKYILSPLVVNTLFVLFGLWALRSPRLKQTARVYIISLIYVGVCFVLVTVHSIFSALYLIFTIPILLTVIYCDYRLTTLTAVIGMAAKVISELFIVWDPDKTYPLKDGTEITGFVISLFVLCLFYVSCLIVIRFEKEKNTASIQNKIEHYRVQQKLVLDELTNINNRKALRNALQSMEEDTSPSTYMFVMLDLDNFKTLNDTLGHNEGDQSLVEFSGILRQNCSEGMVPFRFGGDEFCILFRNASLVRVLETCDRILLDLKNSDTNKEGICLSASIGIAQYEKHMTVTQLVQNADKALYRAKTMKDAIYVYDENESVDA